MTAPRPMSRRGAPHWARPALDQARHWGPGCALCAVIALAATFVSSSHGGPQLLYALFFGLAFHYLSEEPRTAPGIEFCARTLLRLGVALLGARITAAQIAALGWKTAGLVLLAVVTTLALGWWLAGRLRMRRTEGYLSAGSVAICGASAALAISAALPRSKETDRFTLVVVVTVTVLSTLAMVLYPALAKLLHLPPAVAGLFLGATIHDVAQVVGAGYILGQESGDVATVVKLLRVALLAAVVVAAGLLFRGDAEGGAAGEPGVRRPALVPWFLWAFLALVALNSSGALGPAVQQHLGWISRACLVTAIAALGVKTSFAQLSRAGWRPLTLVLAETFWIAALVLGCIWLAR